MNKFVRVVSARDVRERPDITGTSTGWGGTGVGGAFYDAEQNLASNTGSGTNYWNGRTEKFDATRSSAVYGNSSTVQPKSAKVLAIIKI